jgi:glycosyltransferase involved in cell wall biosynthesis
MNNIRLIVAHPGFQHSLKTAEALKASGILYKYITTVYYKETIFTPILKFFLGRQRFEGYSKRKSELLEDCDVITLNRVAGMIEIFLSHFGSNHKFYRFFHRINSESFGRKVARIAIENNVDGVICYVTNSKECFQSLEKQNKKIIRFLDVASANRSYMRKIYENEISMRHKFSQKLLSEVWHYFDDKIISYNYYEYLLTDYFLAPSNFVKKSIEYDMVDKRKILLCPYGAYFSCTSPKKSPSISEKIRILYVGGVTQLKGIFYLLEGLKNFCINQIDVTIVGKYDNSQGIFNEYLKLYNFIGPVSHEKVLEYYTNADIFVYPSLGEGMTLAGLEALSCGLPVICSTNSGINDLIIDGVNGYVIPVANSDAIATKVQWFIDNRDKINEMSRNAIETAKNYTWQEYQKRLTYVITEIINSNYAN